MESHYSLPARLAEQVLPDVASLLEELRELSAKFRPVGGWKTDESSLREAADVFARTASSRFGASLSLDDEDPTHLDAFLNTYLIMPELRPLFRGADVIEGLREAEYETYAQFLGDSEIPGEESLYYFLGAYWGEWLVRHREARWTLFPPLRPMQAFPDMITTVATVCLHPFSMVLRKLADPVGDNLAYKAQVFGRDYLPPYPLTATPDDSTKAMLSLLPEQAQDALHQIKAGHLLQGVKLLERTADEHPASLQTLTLLQQAAWQAEEWETAHGAMTALLRQRPHARTFYNLGAFYAQFELLEEAIESMRQAILVDPNFGRAKLTLAELLIEAGEERLASEVMEHFMKEGFDSALREEAEALMRRLG